MKILSLDPALTCAGLALLERQGQRWHARQWTTIRTPATWPIQRRFDAINQAVVGWTPGSDLLVCEDQWGVYVGKMKSGETNADALRLQRLVGAVDGIAAAIGKPFVAVTRQESCASVGVHPNADKAISKQAVIRIVKFPAGTKRVAIDCFDAMACGIAGERRWRMMERRSA